MVEEHIDAMELLREEMANDDIPCKVNAVHRLSMVILAIGPSQTYDKLIPFLDSKQRANVDLIRKEEDEVLFAIAEELGKVFTLLEDKLRLLPLLEALCSTEETVVREQAVKSLSKIAEVLCNPDIQNSFVPMVTRLAGMEALPSRLSSIGLVAACYSRAGTHKEALRK